MSRPERNAALQVFTILHFCYLVSYEPMILFDGSPLYGHIYVTHIQTFQFGDYSLVIMDFDTDSTF